MAAKRRTYKRDNKGRFATTSGRKVGTRKNGGPALRVGESIKVGGARVTRVKNETLLFGDGVKMSSPTVIMRPARGARGLRRIGQARINRRAKKVFRTVNIGKARRVN